MLIQKLSKNHKATLISTSLWCMFIVSCAIFKDAIVSSVYHSFLESNHRQELAFYLNKANQYSQLINVLFFYLVSSLLIFEFWKKQIIQNRKYLLKILCLCLGFFSLYVIFGWTLVKVNKGAELFGADYEWLLFRWDIWHKSSKPTLLLWSFPFYIIKYFTPLIPLRNLAVLGNTFLGSLAIFLAAFCFHRLLKNDRDTLLYSAFFGLTMSHLFFSVFPESRTLQICSIIPTYIIFLNSLRDKKLYFNYWIFAGVFSFGITITNFSTTLVCFIVALFLLHRETLIQKTLKFVGAVVGISFILSIVQKIIFPTAQYFFLGNSLNNDLTFVKVTILNNPLVVIGEIIKHFLLINIVAAYPIITKGKTQIFSYFGTNVNYSILGLIALLLWLILLSKVLVNNIFSVKQEAKYFLNGVILSIIPFMILHSFFGVEEFMMYTPNFTFLILCLSIPLTRQLKPIERTLLVSIIVLIAINNLLVMKSIISSAGV